MRSTLLLAIVLGLPGLASAAEMAAPKTAEQTQPCAADAARFCAKLSPGPELQRCLAEHKAELSEQCRRRLDHAAARSQRKRPGCEEDRTRFCSGKTGRDLAKCMRANEEKLSASCRAARFRTKACRGDVAKFCAETKKGKARMTCLRSHQAELSQRCKSALAGPS
jgi:hypothetical protein